MALLVLCEHHVVAPLLATSGAVERLREIVGVRSCDDGQIVQLPLLNYSVTLSSDWRGRGDRR